MTNLNILVTGSSGFIGKNLIVKLREQGYENIVCFSRDNEVFELQELVTEIDFVFHFAGVNRPKSESDFETVNVNLTQALVDALLKSGRTIPIVLASSIQSKLDSQYGRSKSKAEKIVLDYSKLTGARTYIYQLPNVFGKWCKPNYNSVVATFCHNIAHNISINIHDKDSKLSLVYIDDVCNEFICLLGLDKKPGYRKISTVYKTTVGELAKLLVKFRDSRKNLIIEEVGVGFKRALYSTFISYYDKDSFSYIVPGYSDARGKFVEMLKTPLTGQFSFFTAHPKVTRGGHYHHSKNEKFLVVSGKARFRFKHVISGDTYEVLSDSSEYRIIETVPGWVHDITNVGNNELIVMLWANEIFDRSKPDTIASPIE